MKINLEDIEYTDAINKKFVFDNEQSSLTLLAFKSGKQRDIMLSSILRHPKSSDYQFYYVF